MSIDWNRPLVDGRGKVAKYMGIERSTNRRRAATTPSGLMPGTIDDDPPTTWLFDENGICRADGQPSEYDVRNS